jgi:hypothetical protein
MKGSINTSSGIEPLPEEILAQFCNFLEGKQDSATFEKWLCLSPNLEIVLGKTTWLELVSTNFQNAAEAHELREKITKLVEQHNPGHLIHEQVKSILEGMLNGTMDLVSGCRRLSKYWNQQNEWIPVIFVGYDSELDEVPLPEQYGLWSKAALGEKLEKVEFYRADILKACENFLKELNGNS